MHCWPSALAAGVAGCTKKDERWGRRRRPGRPSTTPATRWPTRLQEKIDRANQAAQQVADSAEETKAKIAKKPPSDASKGLNKATEEVGKKVERAGEKIQEAAKK